MKHRILGCSLALLLGACSGNGGSSDANTALPVVETQHHESPQARAPMDVPWIAQKPELPRGCEVTSLAMMLQYAGVAADKMTLAAEVDKVPYKEGSYYGNPFEGFVGDMYTFSKPGYGAYHPPIARLAERYLPNQVLDITGTDFDVVLSEYVGWARPVWIVTNARFEKLAASEFETWSTRTGNVQITWHEHSVVITGFDATTVYINDPLDTTNGKNKRLNRQKFREAWDQMGKQAITYVF